MICKNCCGENNNNEQFCKYCHTKLDNYQIGNMQPVYNNQFYNNQTYYNIPYRPVKKYSKAVILLFFSPIFLFIAIIGLSMWDYYNNDNKALHGQWYCKKSEADVEVNKSNATAHLTFNDNQFIWAHNNKEDIDYFKGDYKYKKHYLTLEPITGRRDGVFSDKDIYTHNYEVKIDDNKMELKYENNNSVWECIKD